MVDRLGASSAANHQVRRPRVAGAGRSVRPATASGPTATTTARAVGLDPSRHSTRGLGAGAHPDHTGRETQLGRPGAAQHPVREPLRQGPDAPRRQAGHPEREHPHEEADERLGRLATVLGDHPGEEDLEHLVAERAVHPRRVQPRAQAAVATTDDPARRHEPGRGPAGEGGEATGVEQAAAQARGDPPRVAQRVGQRDEPPLTTHEQPRAERPQREVLDVDPAAHRRVRRVEHLEAAVEEEPVDLVGALPSPDHRLLLEQQHRAPRLSEPVGAAQPRQPGPDDDDVRVHARTVVRPLGVAAPAPGAV